MSRPQRSLPALIQKGLRRVSASPPPSEYGPFTTSPDPKGIETLWIVAVFKLGVGSLPALIQKGLRPIEMNPNMTSEQFTTSRDPKGIETSASCKLNFRGEVHYQP